MGARQLLRFVLSDSEAGDELDAARNEVGGRSAECVSGFLALGLRSNPDALTRTVCHGPRC
jgi:hypothetical protein